MKSVLLTASAIAGMPFLALLTLVLVGAADWRAALTVMAVVAAASLGLGRVWGIELRRPGSGGGDGAIAPSRAPALPPEPPLRATQSERSAERDQIIIEAIAEPVIILGTGPTVRGVNAAAKRQFGTEMSAILRHPIFRAALDHVLAAGTPRVAEIVLPVPVERVLQVVASPLDTDQDDKKCLITLSDRTADRATERMRADFIADASHELRTPLASLMGFIETLRGPAADDPAAHRRFLGIMAEQATRMHRLIDDLLSLSRIEFVEHQRPDDTVDIGKLIERVTAGLKPAIEARDAALTVTMDPALPQVTGDADQLGQVLQNILENALKYGGHGVVVSVTAAPVTPDTDWPAGSAIELAIGDNGPGIASEHLPRLTERFYRVDPARSRAAGGTGLGLAIVKHIINRHRGRLRIDSVEKQGSVFRIWLPTVTEPTRELS